MPRTPSRSEARALAALLTALALAGCATSGLDRGQPRREPLQVEVAARFADDGAAGATASVAVPYRGLVFTRSGDGWAAGLRVTVSARRDGRTLAGAVGEARAVASDFSATTSGERLRVDVPVDLPDDDPVELVVRAEAPGTARWWERTLVFRPGAGRSIPWAFAGFAWNLPADADAGLRLDALLDSLRVTVDLTPRPARALRDVRPSSLVFTLHDGLGGTRELGRMPLPGREAADAPIVRALAVDGASLPFGLQTLSVHLEDDRGVVLPLVPDHPLVNLGVPFADDAAWRRHVAWLEPRNRQGADLDAMARLPRGERAAAWRAFWEAQAPGAVSESEHLERIVEADRRFGRFGRGALSDRGRYFLRYGPPVSVDHHVMDPAVAGDWEVWYYPGEGFKVIFHDAYGLGDYREYARLPL